MLRMRHEYYATSLITSFDFRLRPPLIFFVFMSIYASFMPLPLTTTCARSVQVDVAECFATFDITPLDAALISQDIAAA